MRWCALLLLLAGCRGNANGNANANANGGANANANDWGENAALVPDWALPEERRAPKMPDAEKRWKELAPAADAQRFEGLLICHVQIASKNDPTHFPWGSWHPPTVKESNGTRVATGEDWDTFNGPDPLFRFRFGAARPLQLYGPEDHWQMFISIPRVTLAAGDKVRVDAWDRDVTARELISTLETTFDGKFPWETEAKYLRFDCRGADAARAQAWALPWRDKLDRALGRIEAAEPDAAALDFGVPRDLQGLKDSLRWGSDASFRYYAGYLGWDDPDVHARLMRFAAAEGAWRGRLQARLDALAADSPPPGVWTESGDGWSLRAAQVKCDEGECVAVETRGAPPACRTADYLTAGKLGNLAVYWVASDGQATLAYPKQLDGKSHAIPCDGTPATRFLLGGEPEHARLIRLQGDGAPRFLRVR